MEKLTVEIVASNIEIELTKVIDFGTNPYIIAEIKNLLKRIRDEIRGGDSYFMPKKMSDIDNVFDKYLEEKQ